MTFFGHNEKSIKKGLYLYLMDFQYVLVVGEKTTKKLLQKFLCLKVKHTAADFLILRNP